jgi:hypothetical protein
MWQAGAEGQVAPGGFLASPFGQMAALLVLLGAMAVCLVVGIQHWGPIPSPT